jgi:hypothetical protein
MLKLPFRILGPLRWPSRTRDHQHHRLGHACPHKRVGAPATALLFPVPDRPPEPHDGQERELEVPEGLLVGRCFCRVSDRGRRRRRGTRPLNLGHLHPPGDGDHCFE